MLEMKKDFVISLNNGGKIEVLYSYDTECTYIYKPTCIITITDVKNMVHDVLVHLCNEVYDIKSIEFMDSDTLEIYYNEILEFIDSDYYKEDAETLKDFIDTYKA